MGVTRTHHPSVLKEQQLTAHPGYQKRERIVFKEVVPGRVTVPFLLIQSQPKLDSVLESQIKMIEIGREWEEVGLVLGKVRGE